MMRSAVSLKTKLTIFLIIMASLFCLVYCLDLYFNGRRTIRIQSESLLIKHQAVITRALENSLQAFQSDLSALASQVAAFPEGETVARHTAIKSFVEGSAGNIQSIWHQRDDGTSIIHVRPIKVLGEISSLLQNSKVDIFEYFTEDSLRCQITSGGTALRIYYKSVEAGNFCMQVQLHRWIHSVLVPLQIPSELQVYITDLSGFLRYDADLSRLKQQIGHAYGNSIPDRFVSPDEMIHWKKEALWNCQVFKRLPLNLYLRVSQVAAWKRLETQLIRNIGIAVLLLMLSLVVAQILIRHISDPLKEVTRVTSLVADGDFTQNLDIRRKDEIGLLIDSFNAMVDRLGESHSELCEVNVALEKQYVELKHTRAQLSEKERMALIGETVSKISHEIQNRIGGVSIWVQNMEIVAGDNEILRPYIDEIDGALKRFMELLIQFKQFYRLPDLKLNDIDVKVMLDRIVNIYTPEFERQGVALYLEFNQKNVSVMVDGPQLEDAVINLVRNAAYYSPVDSTVILAASYTDEDFYISVTDQGPGIDEAHIDSLFQPFFTTKSSGSGLGLAMVQRIAKGHGGKATANNIPGGGAVFTMQISRRVGAIKRG